MKLFIYSVIAIVAIAVIAGFFVVGSPFDERLRRFDERRVNDLQNLQWQIVNHWQNKGRIPPQLSDLRDDISGFVPPHDPETGAEYEYDVRGETSFALCATFNLPYDSMDSGVRGKYPAVSPLENPPAGIDFGLNGPWSHGVGRTCFERTIDKELYPVLQREKRI